ncbi:MAG: M48 family metallopeptidase [Pseudomonadota bacterium]
MEEALRNEEFAAKLALTYAELFDGISPVKQRVSLRIKDTLLEIKNVETHAQMHWSLHEMREVPDHSENEAMIFAPDNVGTARLIIREVRGLAALAESGAEFRPLQGPPGQFRRLGIMAVLAAASFVGLLFGLVPWFADRAAERIPPAAEIALGEQLYNQVYTVQGATDCLAPEGLAALSRMENRLTDGVDMDLPLTVRVVRDPTVNATAITGGQVTIHSGLLAAAETPEEVASVLAHEIGHVVNRDVTRAQIRAMGSYGLVGLLFGDVFGFSATAAAASVASQLIDASFSREAEGRADEFAHAMMEDAGLPPEAMASFFGRLQAQRGEVDLGALRHLSTHPDLRDRIAAASAAGDAAVRSGPPVLTDAEWQALQAICGAGPAQEGPTAGAEK